MLCITENCSSSGLHRGAGHGAADQIIVDTAREENATVITKDELIQGYSHVRTFW